MNVLVNNIRVFYLCPGRTNNAVLNRSIQINVINGSNQIAFQGAGIPDGLGMTIDNVEIYKTAMYETIEIDFIREYDERQRILYLNGTYRLPSQTTGLLSSLLKTTGNYRIFIRGESINNARILQESGT